MKPPTQGREKMSVAKLSWVFRATYPSFPGVTGVGSSVICGYVLTAEPVCVCLGSFLCSLDLHGVCVCLCLVYAGWPAYVFARASVSTVVLERGI